MTDVFTLAKAEGAAGFTPPDDAAPAAKVDLKGDGAVTAAVVPPELNAEAKADFMVGLNNTHFIEPHDKCVKLNAKQMSRSKRSKKGKRSTSTALGRVKRKCTSGP